VSPWILCNIFLYHSYSECCATDTDENDSTVSIILSHDGLCRRENNLLRHPPIVSLFLEYNKIRRLWSTRIKYGTSFYLPNQKTELNCESWREPGVFMVRINPDCGPTGLSGLSLNENEPVLFPWFMPGVHPTQFKPWNSSDSLSAHSHFNSDGMWWRVLKLRRAENSTDLQWSQGAV